jgi:hypothetical protein
MMTAISAVLNFFAPLVNWIFAACAFFFTSSAEAQRIHARAPINGTAYGGTDILGRYIFQNLHAAEGTTECRICLDQHPHSETVFVGGCNHGFCHSGLKQHVIAKLREGLFPVLCPVCAMENERANPGGKALLHLS